MNSSICKGKGKKGEKKEKYGKKYVSKNRRKKITPQLKKKRKYGEKKCPQIEGIEEKNIK